MSKKRVVVIEVWGGVAHVVDCPDDVEVIIRGDDDVEDYDILNPDEDDDAYSGIVWGPEDG